MEVPMGWAYVTTAIAATTPIIAGAVAVIAYRQYRIQKDNLRLASFERRAAIYTDARQLIVDAMTVGGSKKDKFLSFY